MSDDRPESSEQAGFKVKDRRRFNPDGSVRPESDDRQREPDPAAASGDREGAQQDRPAQASGVPPDPDFVRQPPSLNLSDFSGLILSLAQAAMIELGAAPDPSDGQIRKNLKMARQTIDTVAMLKDKTAGNLTDDEARLVDGTLYQLRLAFVQCCQGSGQEGGAS